MGLPNLATMIDEILKASPEKRRMLFAAATPEQKYALRQILSDRASNPWLRFNNDPVSFVTNGLGEDVWSKQIEILESVRENKRTAVPACHAPGKSHIAARIVSWWITSHPIGTARVVTTASSYRQVKNILWAHIRRLHSAHGMVGEVFTANWQIDGIVVADGFSPADHNETALQGIHAENLLVVVDEAGGISQTIGTALEALMTGGHTRLLVLGNPPTDNQGSWFERACNSDLYNVIPISAYDTPNFTGEYVGEWGRNLVDHEWVEDVTREFGEESPFVQARVFARFPRNTTNVTLPINWLEACVTDEYQLEGPIRLGVDVAAEGGDEFVVARFDGDLGRVQHASAYSRTAVEVSGIVLEHIHEAEKDHAARGIPEPVRVKVDSIGLGWGVVGLLEEWGKEGRHHSTIVPVNVAERAHDSNKFVSQKAEMWWTMRQLIQPDETGMQGVMLDVDRKTIAQLTGPTYKTNSSGKIQIESKVDMKRRGLNSPDRAEALLLALFEPPEKTIPNVAPLSITQTSGWI